MIEFRDVIFKYPLAETNALNGVSFDVKESEFVVICGKSGCGKTTLLRHIKKNLTPYGSRSGQVLYMGEEITALDDRRNASEIGYVMQNPDSQLVTDKVWHELAFGLESLGFDNGTIRRRVAEMASYFDIQGWFRKDVSQLSGGQKQLLNLASIMAMQPKLLVLDEPTSQLDPIAASEFLHTIYKINRELGITVIISEHRLEEVFTMADRVMVMDQGGIAAFDSPGSIGEILVSERHPMFYGLPSVTKIFYGSGTRGKSPLTIREGRLWIEDLMKDEQAVDRLRLQQECQSAEKAGAKNTDAKNSDKNEYDGEKGYENGAGDTAIDIRDLWFRYDKKSDDVLRGLTAKVDRGRLFCLLGGNGVGKSTTLKLLAGVISPQRGKVKIDGSLAMLPQNPQALFTEVTCEEELMEALHYDRRTDEEKVDAVYAMLKEMEIEHLADSHPYDLSGGEQQRLALGKVLLIDPDIILLDEPTKGLDPFFKITLARVFKKLTERGKTLLMVSHDVEFCAEYGDVCAMFFDGDIVAMAAPHEFFSGNNFYTTTANRMAREYFPSAITWSEVAGKIRGVVREEPGDDEELPGLFAGVTPGDTKDRAEGEVGSAPAGTSEQDYDTSDKNSCEVGP